MMLGYLIGIVAIAAFVVGVFVGIGIPFFHPGYRRRMLDAMEKLERDERHAILRMRQRRERERLKGRDEQ